MADQEMHTLIEAEETENRADTYTVNQTPPELKQSTDPEFQDVNIKHSAKSINCTKENCLCILSVLICCLIVISLVFGAGVVIGKYAGAGDAETKGSKVEKNWGDNVTIGGHSVPVLNWFDGIMKTDNIKNNLE